MQAVGGDFGGLPPECLERRQAAPDSDPTKQTHGQRGEHHEHPQGSPESVHEMFVMGALRLLAD